MKKPIYFILGNHDYYQGTINDIRETLTVLSKTHDQLFWLSATDIQSLPNNTILLDKDGWADERLGD